MFDKTIYAIIVLNAGVIAGVHAGKLCWGGGEPQTRPGGTLCRTTSCIQYRADCNVCNIRGGMWRWSVRQNAHASHCCGRHAYSRSSCESLLPAHGSSGGRAGADLTALLLCSQLPMLPPRCLLTRAIRSVARQGKLFWLLTCVVMTLCARAQGAAAVAAVAGTIGLARRQPCCAHAIRGGSRAH